MSEESGRSTAARTLDSGASAPTSRRGRRRALQTGFSLLARGEPKIWFTGGMLVICLAMIVGLLGLILVSGLPSFWPVPIDLLALDDGTLEIGQLQTTRTEAAKTILNVEGSPLETDDVAVEDSAADLTPSPNPPSDPKITSKRRYYRTGNFRLTGRHYRWLSSQELGPEGMGRPEWAMVVERTEWGRLYGLPLTIEKQLMPSEEADEQLAAITELEEFLAQAPTDESERRADIQQSLQMAKQELLDTALRRQIDFNSDAGNAELRVQTTGSGGWQSYSNIDDDATLTGVQLKWAAYDDTFAVMQSSLQEVIFQRDELERAKFEISRLDAQLSELRVDVRRAEIATDVEAAVQADSAHYLLEQQEALASRVARIPELQEALEEVLAGNDSLLEFARALLDDYRQITLREESGNLEQQLSQWEEPSAEQPQPIRDAITHYLQGYRAIVRQKLPIEKRLIALEQQLGQTQIDFAVPAGSIELVDVPNQDIDNLDQGAISAAIQEQLASQGFVLSGESPEIEKLSPLLTLVAVRDQSGDKLLLAISSPEYLSTEDLSTTTSTQNRRIQLMGITSVGCQEIVRAIDVNRLGLGGKLLVYVDRWREFLLENPREANTEGGVFPAIWGTVVMTLIMTIVVVPFGVMAALYLREYTRSGALVSLIRISINNLAGVPSIVYGVFGFSFFCYTIGAFIDGGSKNAGITVWPSATWFFTLGLAAVIGTAAFFFSLLGGGPAHKRSPLKRWMSRGALCCWLVSLAVGAILVLKSPFFGGLYQEYLPNPTFGKGGLLWASLTLALLTLPVVIVATEEALAAVPNSLREGSLACGASKWQTIRRIVLPHARPGILTGAILAMARGAGEVAPLMLVGALPSAPDLPLDGEFPYFHGSRSFMHLGYQIYTLGFQSQNSEAAKPMVFTCALLLILIVATLNLFAIFLRARLRRKFQGTHF